MAQHFATGNGPGYYSKHIYVSTCNLRSQSRIPKAYIELEFQNVLHVIVANGGANQYTLDSVIA